VWLPSFRNATIVDCTDRITSSVYSSSGPSLSTSKSLKQHTYSLEHLVSAFASLAVPFSMRSHASNSIASSSEPYCEPCAGKQKSYDRKGESHETLRRRYAGLWVTCLILHKVSCNAFALLHYNRRCP
jgi:hypothetical protein